MSEKSNYMRHVGPWNCLRCSFTVPYDPDWGKMSAALMKHVESEHLSDVAGLVHQAQKETATSELIDGRKVCSKHGIRWDYCFDCNPLSDEYTELERLAKVARSAYLAAAKEAREETIRECAKALDQLTGPDASITWNDAIVESKFAILALLAG